MNKDLRQKWVEALRSGDYKQTGHVLRMEYHPEDGTGFCCLGVLADISTDGGIWNDCEMIERSEAGIEDLPVWFCKKVGLNSPTGRFRWDKLSEELRDEIMESIKIHHINPIDPINMGNTATLADLNDSKVPFALIAKIIEEAPEGLFE